MSKLHELPELPYPRNALEPHLSQETLDFHYGKHHATYVKKLNNLIKDTEWADKSLEELIHDAEGGIYNNASQVWNHTFYWHCMNPDGGGKPKNEVGKAITEKFGSFDAFQKQFTEEATGLFGSGWVWLVLQPDGGLEIVPTANGDNPLRDGMTPLLTCDVWEHAFYIDYRNEKPAYMKAFWKITDWAFVNDNYLSAVHGERKRAANE